MDANQAGAVGPLEFNKSSNCLLIDFPKHYELPCLAEVQKGSYRGLVEPHHVIYIHSVVEKQKILAENLKPTRKTRGGVKYSLPLSYAGWFELLSEDGKQIQPIQGVDELLKVAPQQCLVREAFRAPFSSAGTETCSTEQQRQVNIGERLTLRGEVEVSFPGNKGGVAKRRYLRCVDDSGDNIFLGLDLRAQFSPIAGPNNISGVHTLKGLQDKFRLPIIVRLVYGTIPARVERNFSPVFRLLGVYTDETAFVLPFPPGKETRMITISTREKLSLTGCTNWKDLRESSQLKGCNDKCASSIKSYMNSIHVMVDQPDPKAITRGKESPRLGEIRNSAITTNSESEEEERIMFEEIEDIYRYVREGGDPPPSRLPNKPEDGDPLPPTGTFSRKSAVRASTLTENSVANDTETQEELMDFSGASQAYGPAGAARSGAGTVKLAATALRMDDGYWEEPIYEDIDKIRNRKQAGKSQIGDFPAESLAVKELVMAETAPQFSATPAQAATTNDDLRPGPPAMGNMVRSLRQVRTQHSPISSSPTNVLSKQKTGVTSELGKEWTESPPVPRKVFEEVTAQDKSMTMSDQPISKPVVAAVAAEVRTPSKIVTTTEAAVKVKEKKKPPKVPFKKASKKPEPAKNLSPNSAPASQAQQTAAEKTKSASKVVGPSGQAFSDRISSATAAPVAAAAAREEKFHEIIKPDNQALVFGQPQPRNVNTSAKANANSPQINPAETAIRNHSRNSVITTALDTAPTSGYLNHAKQGVSPTPGSQFSSEAQNLRNQTSGNNSQDIWNTEIQPSVVNPVAAHPGFATPGGGAILAEPRQTSTHVQAANTLKVSNRSSHVPPREGPTTVTFPHDPPPPTNLVTVKQDQTHPVLVKSPPISVITPSAASSLDTNSPRSSTPQTDQLSFHRTDSPPRPIVISPTSNPSRVNWSSQSGSTIQIGTDSGTGSGYSTTSNGVTTVHVSGSNPDYRYHPPSGVPGNTQVYVRLPNSPVGQSLSQPQATGTGIRVQSGTVFLTNARTVDSDHWA